MMRIAIFCILIFSFSISSCGNDGAKFSNGVATPGADNEPISEDARRKQSEAPIESAETQTSEPLGENIEDQEPGEVDESLYFSFFAAEATENRLNLQVDRISHEIRMGREVEQINQVKKVKQISRDRIVKTFVQGSSDGTWSDTINQSDSGVIDLLLVIDNSRSMLEEQLKVGSNLRMLLSEVSTADWKIKVVSTDTDDSCQGKIIQSGDLDPERRFYDVVLDAGTLGSTNEEGVRSAVQALECGDEWMRPNSNLSILIVSDEDNCSNGHCQNDPRSDPNYLKSLLKSDLGGSKRVLGDDARIYGVIYKPGDFSCQEGGFMGRVYERLINDTNGKIGSICASDYSDIFSQISHDIRSTLKASFVLEHQPRAETMRVVVNGVIQVRGRDYEVLRNSLVFKHPPQARARIKIGYSFAREPMYDHFDLGQGVGHIQSVKVELESGKVEQLESDAFSVRGTEIKFKDMPQERAKILVDFRKDYPELKKQFYLSEKILPGSLHASVAGKEVAYTFDPATSTVHLLKTALDAQGIRFDYIDALDRGPKYAYKFTDNTESVYGLSAHDTESGEDIFLENSADGVIRFFSNDYVDKRTVMLEYFTHDYSQESIVLPDNMKLDQFSVLIAGSDGSELRECMDYNLNSSARELWLNCDLGRQDTVEIHYKGIDSEALRYKIDVDDPEAYDWIIKVDDITYDEFERTDNFIKFDPNIRSNARIFIQLIPKE